MQMTAHLRLLSWDDYDEPEDDNEEVDERPIDGSLCLGEFFELAILPAMEARDRRPSSVLPYRDLLRWWRQLTSDPPISMITQKAVTEFRDKLRDARWRRSKFAQWRPLAGHTQAKLLRCLRTLLNRCGHGTASQQGEGILRRVPYVPLDTPRTAPKRTWSIDQAKAIAKACGQSWEPRLRGWDRGNWSRLWISLAAYTGLRRGTLMALRRRHVVQDSDGQWWLEVDAETVSKTHRQTRVAMHSRLIAELFRSPDCGPDSLLLPWPWHKRQLDKWHFALQLAAGLADDEQREIHGWRRWHGSQIFELGFDSRMQAAQAALGHASARTTSGHYVVSALATRLPDLWQ